MDFLPTREYCRVDTGNAVHEGVLVRMPPGRTTATIIKGPELVEEKPGALDADAVTPTGTGTYTIDFTDGTRWRVEDMKKPCGCG